MSKTKEKDLKMEKLTDIEFHTSHNKVTNLFQHETILANMEIFTGLFWLGLYNFTVSSGENCLRNNIDIIQTFVLKKYS